MNELWPYFVDVCEPSTPHPESTPIVRLGFSEYERARLCVNALSALDSEKLIGGWNYHNQIAYIEAIEKQRDELLAALKQTRERITQILFELKPGSFVRINASDALEYTDNAILKAEGKGDE